MLKPDEARSQTKELLSLWCLGSSPAAQGQVLIHQPRSSLNPFLWTFVAASLHRHDWWNNWPLVLDSVPSPFPGNQVMGLKVLSPLFLMIPPATSSQFLVKLLVHYIYLVSPKNIYIHLFQHRNITFHLSVVYRDLIYCLSWCDMFYITINGFFV